MFTIFVCFFLSVFFCLYLLNRGIDYRETIRKLDNENKSLREANRNLAEIVQETYDEKYPDDQTQWDWRADD